MHQLIKKDSVTIHSKRNEHSERKSAVTPAFVPDLRNYPKNTRNQAFGYMREFDADSGFHVQ